MSLESGTWNWDLMKFTDVDDHRIKNRAFEKTTQQGKGLSNIYSKFNLPHLNRLNQSIKASDHFFSSVNGVICQ
ncbi:hypothetical protein L1987_21826 [Smallanthus sonchifolius]|uniref:Uncharacterized protein n=1 Tax=Smallanthus sonchifolius TaxID=185202 RepID=A0ACB9IEH0_9ASTR|nr:hypothetical protein L1987_21826 [Smallanthus sonchifolius]